MWEDRVLGIYKKEESELASAEEQQRWLQREAREGGGVA